MLVAATDHAFQAGDRKAAGLSTAGMTLHALGSQKRLDLLLEGCLVSSRQQSCWPEANRKDQSATGRVDVASLSRGHKLSRKTTANFSEGVQLESSLTFQNGAIIERPLTSVNQNDGSGAAAEPSGFPFSEKCSRFLLSQIRCDRLLKDLMKAHG